MEDKLLYFHFFIGDKKVQLRITQSDGTLLDEASSPLNFEDNLFSALNVLHRLMNSNGRSHYRPDQEFIRKIGRIQASLLNITGPSNANPVDIQTIFEKHWKALNGAADAHCCFTFDFAQQAPYTELAGLPWEFLSYQNLDLALHDKPLSDFIRFIQTPKAPQNVQAISKREPLRLLLVISEPDPEVFRRTEKSLVAYRETYIYRLVRMYENMLEKSGDQIRLRVLFQPRPKEVQQALVHQKSVRFGEFHEWFQKNMLDPDTDPIRSRAGQDEAPHVVHFMGHVALDEREEEEVGCVTDDNDLVYVNYNALANCFANNPPQLLILQTPEGVQLHKGPMSNSGLLTDLALKRLPYILSFQHPLREQGSLTFLRAMYAQLFDGASVPAAVRAGRRKLSREKGSFSDVRAFGSPTLYTTLPENKSLHCSLIAQYQGDEGGAERTIDEQSSLEDKIRVYGVEIRRLVEHSETEMALNKFKEIINIAIRSPESDTVAAERFQDDVSGLLSRFNRAKKSFDQGHINHKERSQEFRSVESTLLDYFKPSGFPRIVKKTTSEKPAASTPRLR